MRYKLFSLILLVSVLISCEEEGVMDLPDEEPVFRLEGVLDGSAFVWEAGVNEYYQYTRTSEENGHSIYSGSLQPQCPDLYCGEGISILFYDSAGLTTPAGILGNTPIEYYHNPSGLHTDKRYLLELIANNQTGAPQDFHWTLGSLEATGLSLIDTVENGNLLVCLTSLRDQCSSQICRTINPLSDKICEVILEVENDSMDHLQALAVSSGSDPFSWAWNTGTLGDSIIMFESNDAQYICATMVDAENCIAVSCAEVVSTGGNLQFCQEDFGFNFTPINKAGRRDQTVEVIYTDADGNNYSSANIEQSNARFQVTHFEKYRNNAANEPAWLYELSMDCKLSNAEGETLQLEMCSGVFSLAH